MALHREKHIYAIKPELGVCSHKTMSGKEVKTIQDNYYARGKISQPAICTCS